MNDHVPRQGRPTFRRKPLVRRDLPFGRCAHGFRRGPFPCLPPTAFEGRDATCMDRPRSGEDRQPGCRHPCLAPPAVWCQTSSCPKQKVKLALVIGIMPTFCCSMLLAAMSACVFWMKALATSKNFSVKKNNYSGGLSSRTASSRTNPKNHFC